MIKDKLVNAKTYCGISENLTKGFEWLKSNDLGSIKPDKYIIDGNNLYANVQEYNTKEDAKYEAHKKYIDIQYMIKGSERAGVTHISNCTVFRPYDKDNDIEFLNCNTEEEYVNLNEGEFLVFFPDDAHKPSINPLQISNDKNIVKKVVVKVAID